MENFFYDPTIQCPNCGIFNDGSFQDPNDADQVKLSEGVKIIGGYYCKCNCIFDSTIFMPE